MKHKPGESCPCVCGDTCRGADCPCCADMKAGEPCKCCCDLVCVAECVCCCEQEMSSAAPRGEPVIRERFSMAALDASGTGPKWNLVIPAGEYHGPTLAPVGGSFNFTADFFEQMVANWKANGSFRIPVRWGHEHETNDNPAIAAQLDRKGGNIIDLRVTAAGLEGLTDWNDAGRKDVASGEFDGWSGEFRMRHLNRLTGQVGGPLLTGVALTNRPFFNLMPPVAASALAETTEHPNQEQQMTPEQLKKWALSLGLSADATAEQCMQASAERDTRLSAAEKKLAGLSDAAVISAAVKPLEEKVVALEAKLKAEQDKVLARDVDALIVSAKRGDGKTGRAITEPLAARAQKIAASEGLKAAEEFLTALPLTVPVQAVSQPGSTEAVISASDAAKRIAARAEELRKAGDPTPTVTAMREMPREALIAENRPTAQH